jgi:hypothetical protein
MSTINGARMEPNLPIITAEARPVVLVAVGKSSAPNKYKTAKQVVINNFPDIETTTRNISYSK